MTCPFCQNPETGSWKFTIPGPILGYRQGRKKVFDPRYIAYKKLVRTLATKAGVPVELKDTEHACLSMAIFWKKKARIDLKNVVGAVEDGMFRNDRRILEYHRVTAMEHMKIDEFIEVELKIKLEV